MKAWDEAWLEATVEQRKTVRRWKLGVKHRNGLSGDRNQCPSCGEFFSSSYSFDKHRTGPFGKPDGVQSNRRCLSLPEMAEKGFLKNATDYWVHGANPLYSKNASSAMHE